MTTMRTTEDGGLRAPVLRPQFAQRMAAERGREWAAVRLIDLELVTGLAAIPEGHLRARATVCLGRLTPADVCVHLMTPRAFADDVGARDGGNVRLTCARGYGNGTYLFEGHVAEGALGDHERLRVLIEPCQAPGTPAALATPAGRKMVFTVSGARVWRDVGLHTR
ncbi:MAG TPA: hypothetical protein VGE02_00160 [Gemmatimonadales bacterium]